MRSRFVKEQLRIFYDACAFFTLKSRSAISMRLRTNFLLSSGSLEISSSLLWL